ncbi:anaerobic ribonucleoside-triphosphate reductase activating protein [Breznakia sp. PF5-3]|uniref:anaerobic ribonucleoside-triphosphate reductase activating protein n=1 Tax=unclassified Breznakia TaxID=2623764 RepID=UPI002406DCBF|nr:MULTISPECIES: anaerobic ribonucleoside-triphosphate reductase activating protein [unclassified Breznakia]MDL2276763.1 anaerobic ribonucleoside-triphosphate reductase activating protein [Breznakia sp. OttesenSCG-928-G09]MDF9825313.1 anaerobic ribonucleoside-triphosphate reductase activating protein [Breznakia sp. PM6-1]MDF9836204.1 anaerobic ribonucleoside-triphosphate reductase activating protein [Breznakia sp. PF5-3]MDF9838433.1 anaerobic ribonucleoside-triphosphate reductase activating pro
MLKKIRLASELTFDSIVDGPGLRVVLWTQGCPHQCKGCHNPETWDMEKGFLKDVDEIIDAIKASRLQKGLTISGGEPFLQPKPLIEIAKAVKQLGMNIWIYSGYTYEEIIADQDKRALLEQVDVLVDGKFIEELKSYKLLFKGSSNQRIVDVPRSLLKQEIVLLED